MSPLHPPQGLAPSLPCPPCPTLTHHIRKVHLRMRVRRGSAVTSTPSGAIHSVSCSHHSPVRLGSRPASSPGANCPPLWTAKGSSVTHQDRNRSHSMLGAVAVLQPTRPTQAQPRAMRALTYRKYPTPCTPNPLSTSYQPLRPSHQRVSVLQLRFASCFPVKVIALPQRSPN